MKLLDYVATNEFRTQQKKRGWKIRHKGRRNTKFLWKGERNHFRKQIEEEDWGKRGGLKKQESNRTLRRKVTSCEEKDQKKLEVVG